MKCLTLAAVALSLVLTACSSSKSNSSPSGGAPASTAISSSVSASQPNTPGIVIDNFSYSGTLTVKAGQKVMVRNNDSSAHTLTDKKTHLFDTGNIAANGGTATFTAPDKPGTYEFGCKYHPNMKGTLTVQD